MSAHKSRTRVWTEIAIAVLVLGAVFTWSESLLSDKVGPGTRLEAAIAERYEGASVLARELELPIEVELLGTVRPAREATIAAQVMGTVLEVEVDEGDRIERGDRLVTIGADELRARATASGAQVQAAEARLAQATRDLERTRALAAKEAATRVELERAATDVAIAQAALAAARQAESGDRTVAARTALRAPFAGRVLERLVDPGDLASPGRPLLRLETDAGFRLEVAVDERLAASLKLGDEVAVRLDAAATDLTAVVGELEPSTDPGSRTVLVKLDLPPGVAPGSGAFGRAVLVSGVRAGILVPSAALTQVGGLTTVRVVEDERLVTRHVRIGEELPSGEVEVLSGLAAGDRVAVATAGAAR